MVIFIVQCSKTYSYFQTILPFFVLLRPSVWLINMFALPVLLCFALLCFASGLVWSYLLCFLLLLLLFLLLLCWQKKESKEGGCRAW